MDDSYQEAAQKIKNADALLICAGAGIGVDSGLPDFRGNKGFWKAYPPFAELGLSFIDMANPDWFHSKPHLAWGFYGHRLNLYRSTVPHQGFHLIRQWADKKSLFVFTSNVDGQFQIAGYPDDAILECHGSIHHLQCADSCCNDTIWEAAGTEVNVIEETMLAEEPLPSCPECNQMARPNVLMFGDGAWLAQRTNSQQSRFSSWLEQNKMKKIVIIESGAGTGVPTVRMTSESIAYQYGAPLIRINTREPQVPRGQIGISSGALDAMGKIDAFF